MVGILRSLALVALLGAFALQPGPSRAESTDETAVANAVETLRQAMMAADEAKLKVLTAEQLSYGHSSGRVEAKPEFIAPIASKKTVFKTLPLSDQKITLAGDDAIVRHVFTSDVEADGKVTPVKLGVLQVCRRTVGNGSCSQGRLSASNNGSHKVFRGKASSQPRMTIALQKRKVFS